MQQDWGYSALIEYGGKRIRFDTGNNGDILAHNAKAKGVDLSQLDFVVMSHRHGDHMGGLAMLLRLNPGVKIYAPREGFGVYGAATFAALAKVFGDHDLYAGRWAERPVRAERNSRAAARVGYNEA